MISCTGRPATNARALSRTVCMSTLLSRPAMRNLACCQTKEATSRPVKYLRAARPRANQKMEAPIIIVLSTSKNAAPVRSGSGAGGTSVSAAAADASPATSARVSSSSTSAPIRAERPRKGTRTTPHSSRTPRPAAPTLTGAVPAAPAGQQTRGMPRALTHSGSGTSISGGALEAGGDVGPPGTDGNGSGPSISGRGVDAGAGRVGGAGGALPGARAPSVGAGGAPGSGVRPAGSVVDGDGDPGARAVPLLTG